MPQKKTHIPSTADAFRQWAHRTWRTYAESRVGNRRLFWRVNHAGLINVSLGQRTLYQGHDSDAALTAWQRARYQNLDPTNSDQIPLPL